MPKRSTKFYRENEANIMKSLGLKPTPNSGAGELIKADGQNEKIICELKSTDKMSRAVSINELHLIEQQAYDCGKIPVFALNYLTTDETYLIMKPENLFILAKYLKTGDTSELKYVDFASNSGEQVKVKQVKIESNADARERALQRRSEMYKSKKGEL